VTEVSSVRAWPPLIVAEHVPRLVRWRDALLTALAWAAFAMLLANEVSAVAHGVRALRLGQAGAPLDWRTYVERMAPFVLLIGSLAAVLLGFSLQTLRRRSRALMLPDPPAVDAAEQAHRAGLDETELAAARGHRIVVVHVGEDGRLRIVAKGRA
jgi:poly-beta-1,6-N-acetyl-D-glucosamine biosynthesis protein PgaD